MVAKLIPVNVNFTLEFWARGDSSSVTLVKEIVINFKSNSVEFKGVKQALKLSNKWGSWNHFALVNSNKNGIKLLINSVLAFETKDHIISNFRTDNDLLKVDNSGHFFEITELRIWRVALNQSII